MNKAILIGRLTRDVESNTLQSGSTVSKFTIAVDRQKDKDGNKQADFINCVAWGKTGEIISKYFHKGKQIAVVGRITTGSYENKKGDKVYTTDITVESFDFIGNKSDSNSDNGYVQQDNLPEGFEAIDDDESDYPF